jgi:soluble lytic murein transglycosylase-like protein
MISVRRLAPLAALALLCSCGPPAAVRQDPAPGSEAEAAQPPEERPVRFSAEGCEQLLPLIQQVATQNGVEVALVAGIVAVESNFKPAARSRVGATGLMQIMPRTAAYNGCGDLLDPEENLRCGVKVLRFYLDRYEGNLVFGLAAYNSGQRSADKAHEESLLPKNFGYVEKVLAARSKFLAEGCGG